MSAAPVDEPRTLTVATSVAADGRDAAASAVVSLAEVRVLRLRDDPIAQLEVELLNAYTRHIEAGAASAADHRQTLSERSPT